MNIFPADSSAPFFFFSEGKKGSWRQGPPPLLSRFYGEADNPFSPRIAIGLLFLHVFMIFVDSSSDTFFCFPPRT